MSGDLPSLGPCDLQCSNALVKAQGTGKTPALCADDSRFIADANQCLECTALDVNSARYASLTKEIHEYLDYCRAPGSSSSTTAPSTSTTPTTTPASKTSTSSSPLPPTTSISPSTEGEGSKTNDNKTALILGPVLGVTVLLLLLALLYIYLRRRSARSHAQTQDQQAPSNLEKQEIWHKPELPGSLLQKAAFVLKRWKSGRLVEVHEVDGTGMPPRELYGKEKAPPAGEVVQEMDGVPIARVGGAGDGERREEVRYELDGNSAVVDAVKARTEVRQED